MKIGVWRARLPAIEQEGEQRSCVSTRIVATISAANEPYYDSGGTAFGMGMLPSPCDCPPDAQALLLKEATVYFSTRTFWRISDEVVFYRDPAPCAEALERSP